MAILIFGLLLLATGFSIGGYKRVGVIILITTTLCFWLIGSGMITAPLLQSLQAEAATANPTDICGQGHVMVVLGAGTVKLQSTGLIKPGLLAYSRIFKSAQWYWTCKQQSSRCHIILSGGDPSATGQSEATVYRGELLALGVDKADITLESHSLNTYENAKFTTALLKKGRFTRVFLLSSAIHLPRALLYFSHFGVHTVPVLTDYIQPTWSVMPSGYHFATADFLLHEYLGIARFYLYNVLGWNTPQTALSQV